MKRLITLLFVLVLFSCEDTEFVPDFADDPTIKSIEGTWQVEYFYDLSAKERIEKSKDNSWGYDIEVTFQEDKIDTTFTGSNTTNQIAGQYAYRGERTIEILNLSSSFVNQPEWANLFVDAMLDDTVRFATNGQKLRFYYQEDSRYVSLKRIR